MTADPAYNDFQTLDFNIKLPADYYMQAAHWISGEHIVAMDWAAACILYGRTGCSMSLPSFGRG